MKINFTSIYRTSNFAESKALDFKTRNVFKKHNVHAHYSSYSTNVHNTEPVAQTWSEYLYPYFTSDYYYAGQIVTAAAVITVAAVTYYYVAPAVVSYYYNNSNTTAETITNTKNIIIEKTSKIKDLPKTEIEQELTAQLNLLKREHDPESTQFCNLKDTIENQVYIYKNNIKNSPMYTEEIVIESRRLLYKKVQNNSSYFSENIKMLNNKEFIDKAKNVFLHYRNPMTSQEKRETVEVVQKLTDMSIFNIENRITTSPSIVEQYVTILDQLTESLPVEHQYIPTLLRCTYNITVCTYALKYQIYFPIKGTHTENE